jgi:Zn-dependent protease/CBS domain-containing protein
MKSSYKIFSVFGIAVELHITFILFFFLLLFMVVAGYGISSGILALILIIFLFGTVLAHEFAHSLVAKKQGREVSKITLLPIGGLASVDIPENPREEFLISFAGPLFNFVFAGILILIFALVYPDNFGDYMSDAVNEYVQVYIYNNPGAETSILDISTIPNALGTLIWINLVLGIFNLFLPAFPLDGGRVLRSLLAMEMDYLKATRYAIYVGQAIFGLMLFIGFIRGWIFWVFIALFLLLTAPNELRIVEMKHYLKGQRSEDIAIKKFVHVNESTPIIEFLKTIAIPEQYAYPVTDSEERIIGYIDLDDFDKLNKTKIKEYPIKSILRTDFGKVNVNAPAEDILKLIDRDFVFVVNEHEHVIGIVTLEHLARIAKFKSYGYEHLKNDNPEKLN